MQEPPSRCRTSDSVPGPLLSGQGVPKFWLPWRPPGHPSPLKGLPEHCWWQLLEWTLAAKSTSPHTASSRWSRRDCSFPGLGFRAQPQLELPEPRCDHCWNIPSFISLGDRFKCRAVGVSRNEGLLEPGQHGRRDADKSLLPGCASAGLPSRGTSRLGNANVPWQACSRQSTELHPSTPSPTLPPTPPQHWLGRGTARLCPGRTWARICVPTGQLTAPVSPPRGSPKAGQCAGSCCLVPSCWDTGTSASPGGKSMESRRLRFKILGGNAIFRKLGRCQCILPARLMTLTWRSAGTSRSRASARSPGASQHLLRPHSAWAFEQGWGSRWPQDTLGLPTEDREHHRGVVSIARGVITAPQGFCPVAQSCRSKANGSGARRAPGPESLKGGSDYSQSHPEAALCWLTAVAIPRRPVGAP